MCVWADNKLACFPDALTENDDYTADYLQRRGVPQKDREAGSPLAGRGPWSSHSYPLWHQTVSLCGHKILEGKNKQLLVTQKQSKLLHPGPHPSICSGILSNNSRAALLGLFLLQFH